MIEKQFLSLADNFIGYLPNLIAGIILILIGWFFGWLAKRIIVRMSIVLRLERYMVRSRWKDDFSRADIRYGFYNLIGNVSFLIVFLIFLDNALVVWKLNILSDLVSKGILFLPKIIIACAIFGSGWLLASFAERSFLKSLRREDIPRSSLISKFIKSVMFLFFSAMAIVELNIAREIVIIGFSVIFITLGVLTIIMTARSGRGITGTIKDSPEEEKAD